MLSFLLLPSSANIVLNNNPYGYPDGTLEAFYIGAEGTFAPLHPVQYDVAEDNFRGIGVCPSGTVGINLNDDGEYDSDDGTCAGIALYRSFLATNTPGDSWPQNEDQVARAVDELVSVDQPNPASAALFYFAVDGDLVQANHPVYGCANTDECHGWSCATEVGPIPDAGFMPEYVVFNDTCTLGDGFPTGLEVSIKYEVKNFQLDTSTLPPSKVDVQDADYGAIVGYITLRNTGGSTISGVEVKVGGLASGPRPTTGDVADITLYAADGTPTTEDGNYVGTDYIFSVTEALSNHESPRNLFVLAAPCLSNNYDDSAAPDIRVADLHFQLDDTSVCFTDEGCGCFSGLDDGRWEAIFDTIDVPANSEVRIAVVNELHRSDPDDNAFLSTTSSVDERADELIQARGGVDPEWFDDPFAAAEPVTNIENFDCGLVEALGQLIGDVHFVGFDGVPFEVGGLDERWHSVYSDANIAINAKFVYPRDNADWRGSVIKAVSVVSGEWKLLFHPEAEGDAVVTVMPEAISTEEGVYQFGECGTLQWVSKDTLMLSYAGFNVNMKRMQWNGASGAKDLFVNVEVAPPGRSTSASGFLGETWHQRAADQLGSFPGEEADYLVSGPFETDTARTTAYSADASEFHFAKLLQKDASCSGIEALAKYRTATAASNDKASQ